MKKKLSGLDDMGNVLGLDENRKKDLQEIMLDRVFRGYSTKQALERAIKRKLKRKNESTPSR